MVELHTQEIATHAGRVFLLPFSAQQGISVISQIINHHESLPWLSFPASFWLSEWLRTTPFPYCWHVCDVMYCCLKMIYML